MGFTIQGCTKVKSKDHRGCQADSAERRDGSSERIFLLPQRLGSGQVWWACAQNGSRGRRDENQWMHGILEKLGR